MASNTVIVRVLGNTRSLSRSLKKAQVDLAGLDRINENISRGFRTAAIGAAVFGAATVGAGAAGAAALAAVPAAILGVGIAFAAQNKKVKKAFSGLKTHVVKEMTDMSKVFVPVLVKGAGQIEKAFDTIAPYLQKSFKLAVPLLKDAFKGLQPIAKQVGPMLFEAFKAGAPVLRAFGNAVLPIVKGLRGFFQELGKGTPQFTAFVGTLGQGLGQLLPAVGRLLTALAPIGTAILQVLVPALVSLFDWISARIGPAFQRLTGFISQHPTLFRNIGIAIIAFVVAVKAATLGVAVFNGIMGVARGIVMAFQAVMLVVRGATLAWAAAQRVLNLAMIANPIGLVIAAIALLVGAVILAWKKSETFRKVVTAAWNGIKAASVAVFNFLKGFITGVWNGIKSAVSSAANGVRSVVSSVWNAIKSVTSSVWNGIKAVVSGVVRGILAVVKGTFNAARAAVSAAWNAVKSLTTDAWNGIKSAVSNAIDGVINLVQGIQGKVTGALSGAAGWLLDAGRQIIQGLLDGINDMIGAVQDKLSFLTDLIPDWKGPREKDRKLLRPVGRLIMQGLIKGFDDGRAGIKKSLGNITDLILKRMKKQGASNKQLKKANKELDHLFDKREKRLYKHARRMKQNYNRLADAHKRLADIQKAAKDYAADIKDSVMSYGSITNLNSAFNADAMLQQMRARIAKVRMFNDVLKDLIAKGLDKSIIDQLAQAGVEGGLSYALAIQKGGSGAIKDFNSLQSELNKAGDELGNTTAGSMYDAGIAAAEGLIKGLQARARHLTKAARGFARALVKAVKRSLGIRSPSKVFARLGEQTVQGMQVGLKDVRGVQRAVVNMADAMKDSFDRPKLTATAMAGPGGRGGDTFYVTVEVDNTMSEVEMGRKFAKAIEQYKNLGGRR